MFTSLQTTLQVLRLTNNRLQNLDGIYKSGTFLSLRRLTLSSDKIPLFDVSVLVNTLNITKLPLAKNNLKTMSDPRPFLDIPMDLYDNPWHCDAAISWMSSFRLALKVVCFSPPCLRGNDVTEMSNTVDCGIIVTLHDSDVTWASWTLRRHTTLT